MTHRLKAHPAILAREEDRRRADIVLKETARFLQDSCPHREVVEYARTARSQRICLACRLYREGTNRHELSDSDNVRTVTPIDIGFFELRIDQ